MDGVGGGQGVNWDCSPGARDVQRLNGPVFSPVLHTQLSMFRLWDGWGADTN